MMSQCVQGRKTLEKTQIQHNTLEENETTETNQKQRREKLDTNKDWSANEKKDSKADL